MKRYKTTLFTENENQLQVLRLKSQIQKLFTVFSQHFITHVQNTASKYSNVLDREEEYDIQVISVGVNIPESLQNTLSSEFLRNSSKNLLPSRTNNDLDDIKEFKILDNNESYNE